MMLRKRNNREKERGGRWKKDKGCKKQKHDDRSVKKNQNQESKRQEKKYEEFGKTIYVYLGR